VISKAANWLSVNLSLGGFIRELILDSAEIPPGSSATLATDDWLPWFLLSSSVTLLPCHPGKTGEQVPPCRCCLQPSKPGVDDVIPIMNLNIGNPGHLIGV
jgi:hypothetical protein